ncbi:MAG TPA: hypothetical protein VLA10_05900 [Ilumatobacter sp.]|nr:hypothetical protein [Ilumatobacter sp.]
MDFEHDHHQPHVLDRIDALPVLPASSTDGQSRLLGGTGGGGVGRHGSPVN